MILVKGKLLTYNEGARKLKSLHDEKEVTLEELDETEEKLCELEGEIADLNSQINEILNQMRAQDLTDKLPTALLNKGFKLTEVATKYLSKDIGFWEIYPAGSKSMTILEDDSGNIISEWDYTPCLSDLFEISV